jgi:hypothetical protein
MTDLKRAPTRFLVPAWSEQLIAKEKKQEINNWLPIERAEI